MGKEKIEVERPVHIPTPEAVKGVYMTSCIAATPSLREKLVKLISSQKKEKKWMLNQRLGAYEIFKSLKIPAFMEKKITIDYEKLCYFANPLKYQAKNWDDLPKDVKHIYEQLGIPEAEKKYLSGVATQHESQVVYQSLKKAITI